MSAQQPLTYPRAVLSTPGLVHYWRLGGDGPWEDSVGGQTLTAVGGSPQPVAGLIAADDGALRFPGNGPRLNAALAVGVSWSFSALLSTRSTSAASNFIFEPSSGAWLYVAATPRHLSFWPVGGPSVLSSAPQIVNDGNPHLAVVTFDGQQLRLFLDGTLRGAPVTVTTPGNVAWGTNRNLNLGGLTGSWDGVLDEVALFSTALSPEQVARLYGAIGTADLPQAPSEVRASAGLREATVSWTPPESDGGSPITHYLVSWEEPDA